MIRRALQSGLLIVSSLLLGILVLEAGFRTWGWARGIDHRLYLRELVQPDRFALDIWRNTEPGPLSTLVERAYRHYPPFKPNAQLLATTSDYSVVYRINSKGLRDREYNYEKPEGVTRVLAFGDSFTFGTGVAQDDCLTEVAEAALDGVEILNMGVPGYGLDQILLSYLAQGVKYHPDVVLVLLNAPVTTRHRTGIVSGDAVRIPERLDAIEFSGESGDTAYLRPDDPLWTSGRAWFLRHSYALSFLTYRMQVFRLRKSLEAADESYWGKIVRLEEGKEFSEDLRGWRRQRTIALMRELDRLVRAAGARVLAVNIDSHVAMQYLATVPGLDVADFATELDSRGKTRPLTFKYDRHYNVETHRFLGQRLAQELRRTLAPERGSGVPVLTPPHL